MARGFSKVILMGNLTRDIEVRTTASGQNVANFTLAVTRTWRNQNGQNQDQTSFINCVAWGRTGETIAQYVKKGSPLLVSGRLDQRSYDDKDGNKRSVVEVTVEDFTFVSGGRADGIQHRLQRQLTVVAARMSSSKTSTTSQLTYQKYHLTTY